MSDEEPEVGVVEEVQLGEPGQDVHVRGLLGQDTVPPGIAGSRLHRDFQNITKPIYEFFY